MPKLDEKRLFLDGKQVSASIYLRALALDIRYKRNKEDLLKWASHYERMEKELRK